MGVLVFIALLLAETSLLLNPLFYQIKDLIPTVFILM